MPEVAAVLTLWAAGGFSQITPLGQFENFRYTEEHQYGHAVYLWRHGDVLYGIFRAADGVAGDPPTGLVEGGRYSAHDRTISFTTKLISGLHTCRVHHSVPARQLATVKGKFAPERITGTLKSVDDLHPERAPTIRPIVLERHRGGWDMGTYDSKKALDSAIAEVFRIPGPAWD